MNKLIVIGIILVAILLFGCTTTNDTNELETLSQNFDSKISEKNDLINQQNSKIIELQESNEYLRKQKELVDKKQLALQEVYNKLWLDATSCYWANTCSYDQIGCVEHFKDVATGWTAQDLYVYYSDECDMMIRDWDDYVKDNTGELK